MNTIEFPNCTLETCKFFEIKIFLANFYFIKTNITRTNELLGSKQDTYMPKSNKM